MYKYFNKNAVFLYWKTFASFFFVVDTIHSPFNAVPVNLTIVVAVTRIYKHEAKKTERGGCQAKHGLSLIFSINWTIYTYCSVLNSCCYTFHAFPLPQKTERKAMATGRRLTSIACCRPSRSNKKFPWNEIIYSMLLGMFFHSRHVRDFKKDRREEVFWTNREANVEIRHT